MKPKRYAECTPAERNLPWYFDAESAQAAYDMAHVDWNAKTQVPVFADVQGKPIPFNGRGITDVNPVMERDGITFTVKAVFLDKLPAGCVKAGTLLTHVAGEPVVEWLRGPVIPLGNGRFRLALDRMPSPPAKRSAASSALPSRRCELSLQRPSGRGPYRGQFGGQTADRQFRGDSGSAGYGQDGSPACRGRFRPSGSFLRQGRAGRVQGDELVFTPIPVRSRMPITIM